MLFHLYGDKKNKTILALHGMLCDWQKFRELLKPLEETYYVIYPAMTGCYDGSEILFLLQKKVSRLRPMLRRILAANSMPFGALLRVQPY